jgi:hypothetical protein
MLARDLPEGHVVRVIDSADHSYRATRDALRQQIAGWLDR